MTALPVMAAVFGESKTPCKTNVIPSWGDYVCTYGPGTDPAMDTPQAIENMVKHWKGRGFTGLYLRTDLAQFAPHMIRRNRITHPNPRLAALWRYIDDVSEAFEVHAVAQKLCTAHGLEFWAWHPHLYSEGAPEDAGTPGPGRMVPWSYVNAYVYEHPEVITIDRKGNKLWMVPEYAYPGMRAAKVAEFVHMARTYHIKGFIACMRSEVSQLVDPPDKADRFGFNEPVVADMKRLYGVDILTDPRFDVDRQAFDLRDPLVDRWRDLRGSYVTQLFRELRKALRDVDPQIRLAVTLSGDHVGPPLGNWRLDWRTWVDEGLVDELISPTFFEATYDHEAHLKDYLTDVRAGKGILAYSTLRAHIAKGKHPEVKVIATGAYPYFHSTPPAGADGWRTDVWYDTYHLAWYQRWKQWNADLRDFGHIKFLEQGFDDVVMDENGSLEAWGHPAYSPKLRACPGCWYRLGTGQDGRPAAQTAIRRGNAGQAIRLTRADGVPCSLTGWHNSSPDRSLHTTALDNAITNGRCLFEFWLHRATDASCLSTYLQANGPERDIGLHVTPHTGAVCYSDCGRWVQSGYAMPVGEWQRLAIEVDLNKGCYSAYAGADNAVALCRDVKYETPGARHVEQPGVNIPIPVPVYKMLRVVCFVPEGPEGNITYLDDVSVKWIPTLHYTRPGDAICFEDNFEAHPVGALAASARWKVSPNKPNAYFVSVQESMKCGF